MIKNIYKILFTASTSLILSIIMISCGSDSPSQQSPDLQIWDDWTSTTHSYYTSADCSGNALTFNEYANLMIDNAITAEAQIFMNTECLDPETQTVTCDLENWREHVIELWANSETDEEQAIKDEIIANTGIAETASSSIGLLIHINKTFAVSYDGICLNYSTGALEESEYCIGNPDVNYDNGYCEFETEFACLSASGTWDTGYGGSWDEDGDNYKLEYVINGLAQEKMLLYTEQAISIIEYSDGNELCVGLDFIRQ